VVSLTLAEYIESQCIREAVMNIEVVGGKIHLPGPNANGSELFCGMPNLGNINRTDRPANCWNCYDGAKDVALYGQRVSVDYGFAREEFLIFLETPADSEKSVIAHLINHIQPLRPVVGVAMVNIIGPVKLTSTVEMAVPNGIRY
jgi:hypothetical protein